MKIPVTTPQRYMAVTKHQNSIGSSGFEVLIPSVYVDADAYAMAVEKKLILRNFNTIDLIQDWIPRSPTLVQDNHNDNLDKNQTKNSRKNDESGGHNRDVFFAPCAVRHLAQSLSSQMH